jgi:hypothetical protein
MIAEDGKMGTGFSCNQVTESSHSEPHPGGARVVKIIHFNDVYNIEVQYNHIWVYSEINTIHLYYSMYCIDLLITACWPSNVSLLFIVWCGNPIH